MGEEMYVEMIVGPFSNERQDDIKQLLEDAIPEGYETIEFVDNENGTGQFKIQVGNHNYGAADLYEPQGHIEELMEAKVPYVLMDGGRNGVRGGADFSWHPSYGETVRVRDRDTMGSLVLEEADVRRLKTLSDTEFGRAIRGFFAAPGTPAAIEGWSLMDKAAGSTRVDRDAPLVVTDEMVIGAFIHWPLDTHDEIIAEDSVWESLKVRFPKPPVDSFFVDENENGVPALNTTALGSTEEVRVATQLLAGLPAIANATHVELPAGKYENANQEAWEILREAGKVITAAGLINDELKDRGELTWHTGTEQTGDGELNPAIVTTIEKQYGDALDSDGLCVYLAGSPEDGFTVCGPYPGTVTADWIHNSSRRGSAIEVKVPSSDHEGNHGLVYGNNLPAISENEFGWVVVHGGFGEPIRVDGIWVCGADAEKRASELSGKAVPLIGPLQFTS